MLLYLALLIQTRMSLSLYLSLSLSYLICFASSSLCHIFLWCLCLNLFESLSLFLSLSLLVSLTVTHSTCLWVCTILLTCLRLSFSLHVSFPVHVLPAVCPVKFHGISDLIFDIHSVKGFWQSQYFMIFFLGCKNGNEILRYISEALLSSSFLTLLAILLMHGSILYQSRFYGRFCTIPDSA